MPVFFFTLLLSHLKPFVCIKGKYCIYSFIICGTESLAAFMAEEVNKQVIPSWAGFNAILYPEMTRFRNIGYSPMITESLDSSQYDYITTYTVLKHAQKI